MKQYCEQMEFPETFEEFVKEYGFTDKKEVYTNGSRLIPVFRVEQWLEHIQKSTDMIDKSNFSQEQYKTDLDTAYQNGYEKAKKDYEVNEELITKLTVSMKDCTIEEFLDKLKEELYNSPIQSVIPKSDNWIPVSKKLPSDCNEDWVLAQIQESNGYLWIPCVAEYRKDKDDWYTDYNDLGWVNDHNGAFKVISWQPLPPYYKERL